MFSDAEHSDEFVIESETNLQTESSTLAGLGPRSLTPSLDLVMILVAATPHNSRLARLIHQIGTHVEPPFGMLVVYEADDDETLATLTEFSRSRPWLDLLANPQQSGPVGALRCGFRAIGHGPVATVAADGSDDLSDLSRMRRLYAEGHSIVAASRELRGGHRRGGSWIDRTLERVASRTAIRMGRLPLTDPMHSYRLYDAALVNSLTIESQHPADLPLELSAKAVGKGLSIVEVPTIWTDKGSRPGTIGRLLRVPGWWKWCKEARRRHVAVPFSPPSAALKLTTESHLGPVDDYSAGR